MRTPRPRQCRENLEVIHHLLGLGLELFSILVRCEIDPDNAGKMARTAFEETVAASNNVQEDSYKDSTLMTQLLRNNLTL